MPGQGVLAIVKDKLYFHKFPSYGNKIFYGLGFLTLSSLLMLLVSGIALAFMGEAWWLHDPLGVYTRSVHSWSVQAFIALMVLHMLVGFSTSAFRPPRRFVWVLGASILCLALIQTEFGYGLRGDFSSQFRAVSGADFWNGAYLGYFVNPLSHLQEFAIHVAIIPICIFFLFAFHYLLVRTWGLAKPYRKDIPYRMVEADHRRMYARGVVLVVAVLLLADLFPSPYVPPVRISDVAAAQPGLVLKTFAQEYDRTSDTATYFDSINPYTFDTREIYVVAPYKTILGSAAAASSTMISALMPAVQSGLYESVLRAEDPAADTYLLRLLNDMNVLEAKASTMGFSTEQRGMAKDESGRTWGLPPGSWWFYPLAWLNTVFNLPDNPNGDRIAAEMLGAMMLLFICFPYIPLLNRLPEFLRLAPWIWRDPEAR